MEAEESMSPRALLSYRLCGGAKVLVDSLAEQFNKLRLISSRRSSCDAMSADMQTEVVLELMRKLSSFCRDSDFASDFATVGGHTILKELLNADCSSECVQESADDIVCSILTSGNTFPSRSIVATARPTACKFVETSECSRRSNNIRSVEGPIGLTDLPEFTVYLRSIPGSIHGTGQHAVGYLLWSSAVILSRLIVQNKEMLVHNKVILECGSGQGLCGIVAGRYAAAVTLSDFSEILVNNLEYNININQGSDLIEGQQAAIAESCRMKATLIDWNYLVAESLHSKENSDTNQCIEVPPCSSASVSLGAPVTTTTTAATATAVTTLTTASLVAGVTSEHHEVPAHDSIHPSSSAVQPVKELLSMPSSSRARLGEEIMKHSEDLNTIKSKADGTYDVIIGSDLVYCKTDSSGILMVLLKYLSNTGIFVIVLPEAAHRYDTEHLVPTLQEGGFEVYYKTIAHAECKSSEVTLLPEGAPSLKRTWTSARSSRNVSDTFTDNFTFNGIDFSTFLRDLIILDDHLVSSLDEEEFVAWQLIAGHRR